MVVVDGWMFVVVVDGRRAMVVDGWMSVVGVDGSRSVQRHPGGRTGDQIGTDTPEAHPHSRVHCRVIHLFGSWYTRLVVLDHNCLNRVYPCLIVF